MRARERFHWSAALLFALLLPAGAGAEEALLFGNPSHFCRNGAFPGGGAYPGAQPTFLLGLLSGPPQTPIPFLADDDGSGVAGRCPRADNLSAITKSMSSNLTERWRLLVTLSPTLSCPITT